MDFCEQPDSLIMKSSKMLATEAMVDSQPEVNTVEPSRAISNSVMTASTAAVDQYGGAAALSPDTEAEVDASVLAAPGKSSPSITSSDGTGDAVVEHSGDRLLPSTEPSCDCSGARTDEDVTARLNQLKSLSIFNLDAATLRSTRVALHHTAAVNTCLGAGIYSRKYDFYEALSRSEVEFWLTGCTTARRALPQVFHLLDEIREAQRILFGRTDDEEQEVPEARIPDEQDRFPDDSTWF
ncbi:uncharacterized protein B0I36DRAFT_355542 [Microdochium trichocladiopsis]|uniref:Uncharacterized protein n=1 Tax=Microdochium trichocladiopsis TaxID=1682393 RepID=A0A9P8XRY3_9PEZI|nr:uncharacterized protein B0I36DRAFT_355542 [Microdochium trichocladiopsis]KAH7014303.1 hypothetical protein B0I36DRAFT_355542 [Microdochium trichocladiopsis]